MKLNQHFTASGMQLAVRKRRIAQAFEMLSSMVVQ